MNNISLIGRLTKNVEQSKTSGGVSFARFSIAVPRKYSKDQTDFINCIAWRKTAELIGLYVHKGDRIGIDGFVQTGKYEKDGRTVYTFDVVAENVEFLESKKTETPKEPEYEIPEEELPF